MAEITRFVAPGAVDSSADEAGQVPASIEAEQQLLGTLLTNNDIYDRISQIISPEHFYEPVHARIFEIARDRITKSALASPVTLKAFMENDEGLRDLGGPAYLARLAANGISAFAARDYAQMIREFALRRDLIGLGRDISARAAVVQVDDSAEEQIKAAEQVLYQLGEQGVVERGFQSFLKATTTAVEVATTAYQRDGSLSGIPTGLIDLDRKMGGLNNSDLIILAGRPSMGKTSLATNMAFNIARAARAARHDERAPRGGVVGFFSLEMSAEQLAARILSDAAEVQSHRIRSGDMEEDEFRRFIESANELQDCPLYIDDTPALPINQLAARSRKLKRTHGLDVLIVDYLQLLRPASTKDSRVNEVSEITQGLKAIAKELNIPVIALSQLSRAVENREDKRPQLSDLRESGSIEQDADIVMFVFREEYYREREKPADHELEKMAKWQEIMESVRGKAEVILGKQRHGPIGTVELSFEGSFTRFGNLAEDRKSKWE
ncbi:MAG: replicative DNA helicase [Paracoccus sp. (in: a-proteobacteria)]|nr:replicative DNA helicase [Paracoccus sp. (in: a-proteobacteria)]